MKTNIMSLIHSIFLWLDYVFAKLLGKHLSRHNKATNYQPLPWIGLNKSRRTQGTIDRWKAMDAVLYANSSVLDIGCDVGYFVFKAAEKGCLSWGVDSNLFAILIAWYAKNKIGSVNSQFFIQEVNEVNLGALPSFDYIIFLSVFHHWCKLYGFEQSKKMLAQLVGKANKGLFFEMGQTEMPAEYNVPVHDGDVQGWLASFLQEVSGREVQNLGEFEVFVHKGKDKARRYLFLIK